MKGENIVLHEVICGYNTLRSEGRRKKEDRQELSLYHIAMYISKSLINLILINLVLLFYF